MPDDKANYLHRIGRVGRAKRMGLAISLVGDFKEKVWYHSNCNNRGQGCYNTNDVSRGGCTIWYDEINLLSEVEEHLKGKHKKKVEPKSVRNRQKFTLATRLPLSSKIRSSVEFQIVFR